MKYIANQLAKTNQKFIFLDTETTGIEEKDRLIEIAYTIASVANNENNNINIIYKENLYNTEVPINPAASAVHGYAQWHIENKGYFKNSKEYKELQSLNEENSILIAHNSPFDLKMLEKEGIKWNENNVIDTLRVARHLIKSKDVESHSLQYLRYYFKLDLMDEYNKLKSIMNLKEVRPHTALSDIFILMLFVEFLIKTYKISTEEMLKLSKTPVIYNEIDFGNVFEKGTSYESIINSMYEQYGRRKTGTGYLMWAVENMDMLDFDKKHSIKHWLGMAYINKPFSELKKYFDYAMFLSFNKEEFKKGLEHSKKPKEYYINGLIKKIAIYENKKELNDEEKNLYSYIKNVRLNQLKNF